MCRCIDVYRITFADKSMYFGGNITIRYNEYLRSQSYLKVYKM